MAETLTVSGSFSEEALAQRAALEQRVVSLADSVRDARCAREAAEYELASVSAQTSGVENEFATAKRTLEDVTAAFTRSSRDSQQADRRLAELRASEESTLRKFTEASEAAAQFKAAEEFTGRARGQAEEHLTRLREQIAALTAEVAVAEQRAAEERSAEERAARERAAAEHKALELQNILERISMERATYEEQISEQHRVRDEADAKIAAAQARFDEVAPKYDLARAQRESAQALVAQQRELEMNLASEHARASLELQTFIEEQERRAINQRLSALIEAEEAAARELAEAEAKLQALRDEQERATKERVSLEGSVPPAPAVALQPASAAPASPAPGAASATATAVESSAASTVAGHIDADDSAEFGPPVRVRPNLQLVTNTPRVRPAAAPAPPAAGPVLQPPVPPMRMSSVEARKASFNLFGWGKRAAMPLEPEPVEDPISVADRIARDFGNLGHAPEPGAP